MAHKPDRFAKYLAPSTRRERAALTSAPAPGRCFGYARVSTAMQADEGQSLEVQQRVIAGYATMQGFTVEKVFIERGVSGAKPLAERPEGKVLLATLKPGDVVITPRLDRMFRSALDALEVLAKMKAANIGLHMIDLGGDTTTNGISKLVFQILAAVAEAERDRTREKVTEVKRDQRARGRYLGGKLPYGFARGDNGELVEIPEQQKAIRKAKKLRDDGLSLRAIADALRADGVTISHVGVQSILGSPTS